jgi:hypothetical protein
VHPAVSGSWLAAAAALERFNLQEEHYAKSTLACTTHACNKIEYFTFF